MRTITNMADFINDYTKYYKEPEILDIAEVKKEVEQKEGSVELRAHETNVHATVAFFFDEEYICTDEELEEYDTIATYSGNSWK